MFYSVDLLALRKNAKFGKCWLAATWSRKVFSHKFRSSTIKAIDLIKMCDELIIYITHRQFSIYLSSQLLCGATRILSYQADLLLDDLLDCWARKTAKTKSGKRQDEDLQISLQLRDVPAVTEFDFSGNLVDNEQRITLAEPANLVSDVPTLTFGVLTEQELDYILQHDGLMPLDLEDSIRKLPDLPETSIRESEDANLFKKPTLRPVQQIQTETVGLVEDQGVDQSLIQIQATTSALISEPPRDVPSTPTKRTRSSPGIDGHVTPTKRRRELNTEPTSVLAPVPTETEPSSVLAPVPSETEPPSDSFTLASLIINSEEGQKANWRYKTRKVIDKITQIPDPKDTFFKPDRNIRNDTKIKLPIKTAGASLLMIPTTSFKRWGKPLLDFHKSILLNPISPSAIQPPPNPEVVLEPVSAIHPTTDVTADELPTLLENTSKTDGTKTIEQISIDHSIQVPPPANLSTNVTNDFPQPLPEISVRELHVAPEIISDRPQSKIVTNIYRDWSENGQDGIAKVPLIDRGIEKSPTVEVVRVTRHQSRSSKTSSGSTLQYTANVTTSDLFGRIQDLWSKNPVITFKDVVPPSTNTKEDAARAFSALLKLHESKQVKLLQAEPYGHLYIKEYSKYF